MRITSHSTHIPSLVDHPLGFDLSQNGDNLHAKLGITIIPDDIILTKDRPLILLWPPSRFLSDYTHG